MTINELYELCEQAKKNGDGDREIFLCVNGDEFHQLDSGFSSPVYNDSKVYDVIEELQAEEDEIIVLN